MLVHKKEGKEQDTPTSACFLCYSVCRASIETRPDKPHRTWLVAELEQPMAEDSRQPCVARRGRWGPRKPSDCNHSWLLSINQKDYASVKLSLMVVWRDKSHPITLSSGDKVGVVGHRLFEFRGGLRGVQAARASFDGRPREVRYGRKSFAEQRKGAFRP
jgi:hypothetical protein